MFVALMEFQDVILKCLEAKVDGGRWMRMVNALPSRKLDMKYTLVLTEL